MTNTTEHDLYTYDVMTTFACLVDRNLLYTEQNTHGLEMHYDA